MIQELVILKVEVFDSEGYMEVKLAEGNNYQDYPKTIVLFSGRFIRRGFNSDRKIIHYSTERR